MDETAQRSAIAHARRLLGDPRTERQTRESLARTELGELAQSMILHAKSGGAYLALVVDEMQRDVALLRHEVVGQPATKALAWVAFVASMVSIGVSMGLCLVVGLVFGASYAAYPARPPPACVVAPLDTGNAD